MRSCATKSSLRESTTVTGILVVADSRAHKAAHPDRYPVRDEIKDILPSLKGIEERYGPTNVHLQVYDGACHDLALFSMVTMSRGLFRAIAAFARWVTPDARESLAISKPTGMGSANGSGSNILAPTTRSSSSENAENKSSTVVDASTSTQSVPASSAAPLPVPIITNSPQSSVDPGTSSSTVYNDNGHLPPTRPDLAQERANSDMSEDVSGSRFDADPDSKAAPGTAGFTGIYRGENVSPPLHLTRGLSRR